MVKRRKKNYKLTEKQIANIVVAARGKSQCPAAKNFVRKLDTKYKLPKIIPKIIPKIKKR